MSIRDEIELFRLEHLLKELKGKEGRGTELISLYIPAGRPLSEVMSVLKQEYSTAQNIKDRTTRHHVLEALTSIMQRLKLLSRTPPNGLVVFCGYVASDVPGKERMEIHLIEPPEKLRTWLYRCDSVFHVEILEDMIRERDIYGLIVVDRSEAVFGILKGRSMQILKRITSGVPGKHRAGGQSARRFERIIEQLAHEFYKRVGEYANRLFLDIPDLKGIIIGGPGPTKEEFIKGDYLHYELKNKVLGVVDTGYSGEEGVYELVKRSVDIVKGVRLFEEKKVFQEFMHHIARDTGLATYGENEVRRALQMAAVDKLLLSEQLDKHRIRAVCPNCSYEFSLTVESRVESVKCPKCGSQADIESVEHIVEELGRMAKNTGARVFILSDATEEGRILRRTFGGVAAVLRFRI
ncbi:MAG: peptide chain release factor 1 [Thermoprotei archaeon]|nr:MAG: peptide chain release factor 1 [Thermoprotei archaeon]